MENSKKIIKIILIICLGIVIIIGILLGVSVLQKEEEKNIREEYYAAMNSIEENKNQDIIFDYNQFEKLNISDYAMSTKYLVDFRKLALYNIEQSYQYLDAEYREKRFPQYELYKSYINRNVSKLMQAKVEEYEITKEENITIYTIKDQLGNYYMFQEMAPMQYTVILDNYTLTMPIFMKKYEIANTETKVAMQVDRVRQALDAQDYHFIYSKLAESFKQNYFPTEADLENYIKNHFFEKNIFTYLELEKQNDNYIYTVKITNEVETQMLAKTFVVQLLDEGDFVFSFSVE